MTRTTLTLGLLLLIAGPAFAQDSDGLPGLPQRQAPPQIQRAIPQPDATTELERQLLFQFLMSNPDDLYRAYGGDLTRTEFDAKLDAFRKSARQMTVAASIEHRLVADYTLVRGLVRKKTVKLTIANRTRGTYAVVRKVLAKNGVEQTTSYGVGQWNPLTFTLAVTFSTEAGLVQGLSLDTGKRERVNAKYRIQPTTGRIEGKFKGIRGEKGWRDGAIKPIAGIYQLVPRRGPRGYRLVLFVSEREGEPGQLNVRRHNTRLNKDGSAGKTSIRLGRAKLEGRTLNVDFGKGFPKVTYRVREDGFIQGNYFVWDKNRKPVAISEAGWRDGRSQPQLPGLLQRTFGKLKALFGKLILRSGTKTVRRSRRVS